MIRKNIHFLGYGSGFGAGNADTKDGPQALFKHPDFHKLCALVHGDTPHIISAPARTLPHESPIHHFKSVTHVLGLLRDAVQRIMKQNQMPVVIGGDHTQALGSVAGVKQALGPTAKLGLIWIDAHLDAHTPQTTPSGNAHGMPLASLMNVGPKDFTDLGGSSPLIDPAHVIIIGARSFEPEEAELLSHLGVQIYHAQDVKERGFHDIFYSAVTYISEKSTHFGISLDLDVFDPQCAPGVGTPEQEGLNPQEVIPALAHVMSLKKATWLDISEYNPHLDQEDKTQSIILDTLFHITKKIGFDCGVK